MPADDLLRRVDLAFLRMEPGATVASLREAVNAVQRHQLRAIVVPPVLAGTVKKNFPALRVCAVVGYPLGIDTTAGKVFAIQELAEQGVDEVDVVLDLFAILNANAAKVEREAREIISAATTGMELGLKLIIECPILDEDQIRWVCGLLTPLKAGCIKTSTGYGRSATTVQQVRLIREVVGASALIKASGGIRSRADAEALVAAGADILGMSDVGPLL